MYCQNGTVQHEYAFDIATQVNSDGSTAIHDGWDIYGNAKGEIGRAHV